MLTSKAFRVGRNSSWRRLLSSKDNGNDGNDNKFNGMEPPPPEDPFKRTVRVLTNDFKYVVNTVTNLNLPYKNYNSSRTYRDLFPSTADVVIVGGGVMGLSTAYWLRRRAGDGLNIVLIEKDPTYKESSSALSVGGLRQQFSLKENILMSQFGAEFFRDFKKNFGADIDLQFTPYGYLLLATPDTAETLVRNHNLQKENKVNNALLTPKALKERFPWLNTEGLELGCLGLENEGWFDPWALLCGLRRKVINMGVQVVKAEVVGFTLTEQRETFVVGVGAGDYRRLTGVHVRREEGDVCEISFSVGVLAAGAASGRLARMMGIGEGRSTLAIGLPVEPRKRYVYCFQSRDSNVPGVNSPLTIDHTGTYFRREGLGNNFIAGRAPTPDKEPAVDDLEVDHDFFQTDVWPHLAERVPAFESVKVNSSWAGYYEYNSYDENGIIGRHPYHLNLYMATGFSGHGIQQSPAVGRALSELIIDGRYSTIDLARLGFDRMLVNMPMYETNIF